MPDTPNAVQVQIFGLVYTVRAGADPGYVEQLAAYVDEKMHEVSRGSGAVDSVRIAVLAALNIADECFRQKDALGKAGTATRQKANRLAKELASALGE
jgi:cell division protein ZapA